MAVDDSPGRADYARYSDQLLFWSAPTGSSVTDHHIEREPMPELGTLRMDTLLRELIDRAGGIIKSRSQLRGLLDAVVSAEDGTAVRNRGPGESNVCLALRVRRWVRHLHETFDAY